MYWPLCGLLERLGELKLLLQTVRGLFFHVYLCSDTKEVARSNILDTFRCKEGLWAKQHYSILQLTKQNGKCIFLLFYDELEGKLLSVMPFN